MRKETSPCCVLEALFTDCQAGNRAFCFLPLIREGKMTLLKSVSIRFVSFEYVENFHLCQYQWYTFFMSRLRNYKLVPINLASNETVGERIARLRKERGLTQRELAAKIGVSRSVIMDYERGKNHVYDEVIIRIALILGVTTDELLGVKNIKGEKLPSSLKIVRRMKEIEKLPAGKQKKVLENIDILLKGIS
jgi:transcriptional regulator with XRE-family HTH domain